jgi:hypothetical protein
MVGETMRVKERRETTPDSYREPDDATVAMAGDLGDLGSDFVALLELQTELFAIDAREAASRAVLPGAMTIVAIALVVGACPLAMLGVAWWLASSTDLSAAAAAILVAVLGLLAAGLLGWGALRGLRRCAEAMKDSVVECRRNMSWLKSLLKRDRRHRATARNRL